MPKSLSRRRFARKSLLASIVVSSGLSPGLTFEYQPPLAQLKGEAKPPPPTKASADGPPPMAKIGKLRLVEQQEIDPDFYLKTINAVVYESQDPAQIAGFMKTVKKPWIAFKVLGAGRTKPREGFDLAFKMGADFVNIGM